MRGRSTGLWVAGSGSLKVWGLWSGWEGETPVYQEFSTTEGSSYTFSGWAWFHNADPLTATHTYAFISLKFFDAS